MIPRRTIFLSLVLALMLTGCFRQASEPFETVEGSQSGDALNVQATVPVLVTATTEQEPTLDILPTDDTFETVPTIEPLETEIPTEQPIEQTGNTDQTALPTLGAPVTATPLIVQPTNTVQQLAIPSETPIAGATTANSGPTLTPTFITPGVAAGTSVSPTINTTPVAPNGTPATATPSGLITPTDFLNPNNIPEQCLYIVRTGDNLFRIALNNALTLDQLRAANPQIRSDVIQPGDQLLLPVAGCDGETLSSDPVVTEIAPAGGQDQIVHIVQSGETVGQIARRYGTTIADIAQANNLSDPNRLSIGQQLIIPQN